MVGLEHSKRIGDNSVVNQTCQLPAPLSLATKVGSLMLEGEVSLQNGVT